MSQDNKNIAGKTIEGSLYSVVASIFTIILGAGRTILLVRLLPQADFGLAALALFFLNLVSQLRNFGIDKALIHNKRNDEIVLRTYFTLRMILIFLSLFLLGISSPFIASFYPDFPLLKWVLWGYIAVGLTKGLNTIQVTILSKQLAFRNLAITDVLSSLTMTIVGPLLAWQGFGVWSLLLGQLSGLIVRVIIIWFVYRAWQPRFGWDQSIVRWFWDYGTRLWMGGNFIFLNDQFDDWWVGTFLGAEPLGVYSRAYEFAQYARRTVAAPILSVFFPVFAQIQDDKQKLSRAFFRAMSLMLRAGVLFSLMFILTASEFIELLLTDEWLPMLVPLQLMIIYTLFDPMVLGANNLLTATGYANVIMRTRMIQTAVFLPAVIFLGITMGIVGVALAADIMILVGAVLLFRQTKQIVDYSNRALWLWPLVALVVVSGTIFLLTPLWATWPAWQTLFIKLLLIPTLYVTILGLTEREQLLIGWRMIWGLVQPRLTNLRK